MPGAADNRASRRAAAMRAPRRTGLGASGDDYPCLILLPHHSSPLEVEEMREDRAARRGEKPRIDVCIHVGHHRWDPPLPRLEVGEDLPLAAPAMFDQA